MTEDFSRQEASLTHRTQDLEKDKKDLQAALEAQEERYKFLSF